MRDCAQIHESLPAYAGGELGPQERQRCEAHLSGCPECQERLLGLTQTLDLLHSAAASEELPADFQRQLHLRLVQEPAPRRSPWARWRAWLREHHAGQSLASALCGAVAMLIAVWAAQPQLVGGRAPGAAVLAEAPAPFQVPSRRVAVVDLSFVTDQTIDNVQFEVTLPQGLAFIDAEGGKALPERTLRWSGALAPGDDPIRLPVSGSKPGRYRIVARATAAGLDLTHDVWLEVVRS